MIKSPLMTAMAFISARPIDQEEIALLLQRWKLIRRSNIRYCAPTRQVARPAFPLNRAGDSVYGLAARCARIVDTAEALIGEFVYHFQSN